MKLAGGFTFDDGAIGHVVGPSITPSGETGRDSWTEAQIVMALGNGAPSDSAIIGPQMPVDTYREPSDRDAAATAANLRKIKPIRRAIACPDLSALVACLRTVKP
ncbi:MAG: hypothetical protein WA459_22225 [Stellaceae bacterium]